MSVHGPVLHGYVDWPGRQMIKWEESKGQDTVLQRSYSRGKRCLREKQETRSIRKARQLTVGMCIFVQNTAKFATTSHSFFIFSSSPQTLGSQSDQNCIKIQLQHVLLFLTSVLMYLTPPWHLTQIITTFTYKDIYHWLPGRHVLAIWFYSFLISFARSSSSVLHFAFLKAQNLLFKPLFYLFSTVSNPSWWHYPVQD